MTRAEWEADRPPLTRSSELTLEVWYFCGGWNPQTLPLACAYFGVEDAALLMHLLIALRGCIAAYAAAQREE
jgi:hypothetical protein